MNKSMSYQHGTVVMSSVKLGGTADMAYLFS